MENMTGHNKRILAECLHLLLHLYFMFDSIVKNNIRIFLLLITHYALCFGPVRNWEKYHRKLTEGANKNEIVMMIH